MRRKGTRVQETAEEEGEKKTTKRRGRRADKPQQEATHARAVRLCVRAPRRETARPRERSGKEGRESDAEAGRAGPPSSPPLPLFLSFPSLLPSPPPSLSLWSRRVAASDSV